MVANREEELIYFEMEEIEGNMYEEFKGIVEEVSTTINQKILSSQVFKPLEETLKRYESQLPKIKNSIERAESVNKYLELTKANLSKEIASTIKIVSNQVIKDVVLLKLEEVLKKYETQTVNITKQSSGLKDVVTEMKKIENLIITTVNNAIEKQIKEILEEKILKRFDLIQNEFSKHLSFLDLSNKETEGLLGNLEITRKNIHKDTIKSYEEISRSLNEYLSIELTGLYDKFGEQIAVIESNNQEFQNTITFLNKTVENLQEKHELLVEKFSEVDLKIEALKRQNSLAEQKMEASVRKQFSLLIGIGLVNIGILISLFI